MRSGPWIRAGAAALVLAAAAAWCGLAQVDGSFVRTHVSLDLDRPDRWVVDRAAVAPGTLGHLLWRGQPPFEATLGPVGVGDILKLKLRTDQAPCAVVVALDGVRIADLTVNGSWRQLELVAPSAGSRLRLAEAEGPAVPIHVSRASATNVRGFIEGPLQLYVQTDTGASRSLPRPGARWLLALVAPTLLLLVVGWRRLLGERDGLAAVRAGLLGLLPGAAVMVGAELVRVLSGLRLVYPARTFLLLLAAPPVVVEAVRARALIRRWAGAVAARCVDAVGALDRRLQALESVLAALAGRLGLGRFSAAAAEATGVLSGRDLRRAFLVYLCVVTGLGLAFAVLVIGDFGGPMLDGGDINLWSHQGYYLGRNLSFTPLPHLDLVNDQLWYPYGGSNVFQAWVFEMASFSALGDRLFGAGPWLQVYYLLTVLMTSLGAFVLLAPDHGALRASVVGIAVSFCNYYAIGKYAGHLGVACSSWVTLNLLADWILVRRLAVGRAWSARLLALRALLLVLALGQDLSYQAGMALTSFSVCALFVVVVTCARCRCRPGQLAAQARSRLEHLRGSAAEHPAQVAILVGASLLVGFLWVPIVLQVSRATAAFDLSLMPHGGAWANPLRLLIPVFPGFNPTTVRLFHDSPEAWFAASPGLFFLLAGLFGVIWGWRRVLCWLPFLFVLVLLLSFHPERFALLRVLPWFSYVRICGRFTVAYPALLSILSLSAPVTAFKGRRGALLAVLGCGLLAVEAVTAYRVALIRPRAFYRPDSSFTGLMQATREAPGEALLEWPFCIAGGNGVGTGELGRFYHRQCGISVLQEFHHKKVVGEYFGRLHPDQLRPYLEAGWPRMFFPDRADPHRATRQRRDFLPPEWAFLERFFVLNDFCGVLLFTDLVPAATVAGFHQRFGVPVAVAEGTPFGRLEFIAKRPEWRLLVDREAGKKLVLPFVPPPRPVVRLDMGNPAAADYLRRGWGGYQKRYRSSEGPAAEIVFSVDRVETLLLNLRLMTFQRQRIVVLLNGVKVDDLTHDGGEPTLFTVILPAELLRPDNVLRFQLPDAHSPKSVGVNADTRVLGITLDWLELEPAGQPAPNGPASAVTAAGRRLPG